MDRPIGYWLKHLDALISADFERTLAGSGLTRRHWQVLNSLTAGPCRADELSVALLPFWGEGAITLDEVLASLRERGWVEAEGVRCVLTPLGAEGQAEVAGRVGDTRRRLMDGVTAEQYAETVRVLSRMAANLESASPAA
ncbi:MarR family winged helix-turn-helix transcriptional regulator [Streptomyces coffeae]|uniref:MarR family transcriptional regulator n=1 Tax=Streptomyces coffeae TaxID=621382 RepID=A0ABS1NJ55_9ACTN|nr:MarR family transcriptional regulator [Streptomyces coffeae]MBL1099806.1 MarR family transcriptional regulator [Streptomyces coffeae]